MEIYYKKQHSIASLFTRFIIGFGAGFVGMIVLALILFLSWSIMGDYLQTTNELTDSLGSTIGQIETHSLFLILVVLAIFVSTLVTTLAHAFLNTLVDQYYTKRTTALTHIFYGNVVFLIFTLPLYVIMNKYFQTSGIIYIAIMHAFLTCFFSISVLQALHQAKYTLVNLYGNLFGLVLFLFMGVILLNIVDPFVLIFLAFPLFMGIMAIGNRFIELFYAFLYTKTGIDMLNIETTYGNDYGVPVIEKDFNEEDEFEKEFKI